MIATSKISPVKARSSRLGRWPRTRIRSDKSSKTAASFYPLVWILFCSSLEILVFNGDGSLLFRILVDLGFWGGPTFAIVTQILGDLKIDPNLFDHLRPCTPPDILLPTRSCNYNTWSCPRHSRLSPNPLRLFQSIQVFTQSCPLLAMRFLPTDFPLASHQASTAHGHQVTAPHHCLPTEQFALPTPPSPPPIPLSLCLPPGIRGGRWVIPARGFLKGFLIVS